MTSFTVVRLHEPSLLLYKAGIGFGCSGRTGVVSGTTEQRNRPVGVAFSNLLPPNALQIWSCKPPGFDPTPSHGNLLWRPTSYGRNVFFHWCEHNGKLGVTKAVVRPAAC